MKDNARILVYGAGAIGSIFAGKLARAGFDVTVLARGDRLAELRRDGLVLRNSITGRVTASAVMVIESLQPEDLYDFIIVAVQNTQVESVLPALSANRSENIVFVVNNPLGYGRWFEAVGRGRVMIGFPSAGGERKGGMVHYFIGTGPAKLFQSTTFGEPDGRDTPRLRRLVGIFRRAGFSPDTCRDMDAWQKTHVAMVVPVSRALYRFASDNYRLSRSGPAVRKMVLAVRECFDALRLSGVRVTPAKLNFFYWPLFIIVPLFRVLFATKIAEYAMAKHTVVAKGEIDALEVQLRGLLANSGVALGRLDSL